MTLEGHPPGRLTRAARRRQGVAEHAGPDTQRAGAGRLHAGSSETIGSGAPHHPDTTLVLIGGGHAHVEVLRRFAMRPLSGVRVIVVSATPRMLYSGMLPGMMRGEYSPEQASINLAALAHAAGARMILGEALAIDLASRRVVVAGSEPIAFDLLSLNVGGRQAVKAGGGMAVKPIEPFVSAWTRCERTLPPNPRVVVVGAGPAGVELTLALATRYRQRPGGGGTSAIRLTLVGAQAEPMARAPKRARRVVRDRLIAMDVSLVVGVTAMHQVDGRLHLSDGSFLDADAVLWAGGVRGPGFLSASGLACDGDGCVRVDHCFRSLSHPFVFASGDCAALQEPRPKAGVWAVRAGGPLADNLRRALAGGRLRRWRPQREALVMVGLGDGCAVAWRNRITAAGGWVWTWKDWIDRRWIGRYRAPAAAAPGSAGRTR